MSVQSPDFFRYESRKTLMAKVVLKTPKYCDVQLVDTNSNHKDIYLISLLREKTAVQSSGPKRGLVKFSFKEGQRRVLCFHFFYFVSKLSWHLFVRAKSVSFVTHVFRTKEKSFNES